MRNQFPELLLLTLAALLLGACSLGQLKSSSENRPISGTNNPSIAGSAFTPSGDARRDVVDSLRKLKTAYPYRMT